jgi:hypothetical protein
VEPLPCLSSKRIFSDGPCDGLVTLRVIIIVFIIGKGFTTIIFIIGVTLGHDFVCTLTIFRAESEQYRKLHTSL